MARQRDLIMPRWLMVAVMVLAFSSVSTSAPLVVERNLFAQDRKPPSDEPAAPPTRNTPGLSPKAIQLDGVFIRGDKKEALLRMKGHAPGKVKGKDQSPYVRVHEGEKIDEYQVVKIEPRSVLLEKDGETVVVNLFAEGKVVPPPPPIPVSPGAPPSGVDSQESPPGQPGMRIPRPIPPPGQLGGQPPHFDPNTGHPVPGNERAVRQGGHSPDDEEAMEADEEEPMDEEEVPEDSGS